MAFGRSGEGPAALEHRPGGDDRVQRQQQVGGLTAGVDGDPEGQHRQQSQRQQLGAAVPQYRQCADPEPHRGSQRDQLHGALAERG